MMGSVRHPQHTQTGSNSSTIAADISNGVTNTRCCRYTVVCAPDDGWKYHPKHVEQFPDINTLCNVASCWIYIGILLGAHPILHISRIKVNTIVLLRISTVLLETCRGFNHLRTKCSPFYLKFQAVPHSKHLPPRL